MDRAVAMLSDAFHPHRGGHARVAYKLAESVRKRGWEVVLVCAQSTFAASDGFSVVHVPRPPGSPLLTSLRAGLEASRIESEVDVFHSNGCFGFSYLSHNPRKPFLAHMHTSTPRLARAIWKDPLFHPGPRSLLFLLGNGPAWITERFALAHADLVLANSTETARTLISDYQLASGRVAVLNNGCDLPTSPNKAEVSQFHSRKQDPKLLTVTRLAYTKGLEYLLEAMTLFRKVRRGARLTIVGSGPLNSLLRRRITKLGLAHSVVMAGYREGAGLDSEFRAADLFVYGANPGMTVIEAMSYGLPFVLRYEPKGNPSGIPMEAIVNAGIGAVTTSENPKDFADLMERALDDEEWRATQFERTREFVRKHLNWDRAAQTAIGYYDALAKRRSSQDVN